MIKAITLNKKEHPMKIKCVSKSGFFNPRALAGFGFGVIGLLLGLVAIIALPKHSAWARPAACTDVAYSETAGPSCSVVVTMESHSIGYPDSPCTIYYNVSSTVPPDPTHSSASGTSPVAVPVAAYQQRYFKAFGHKLNALPEDSAITSYYVNNTCPCCF
jgi:hypothetical protein